ncbi:MAG: hypothetical protein MUF65_13990 [Rubritepida sp.]|jgi:hypothetical protein|nr:hypothetical protein [Rubritepida sp.]
MLDVNPPPAARAPRTFEMHGDEWVEAGRAQTRRAPLWLIVPALLAATTAVFVVAFAVLAALFTGGLLAARRRFIDAAAQLRARFGAATRR